MRDLDGSLTAQGVEGMKPDALPLESGLFTLDSESVSLDSLCGTWKLYNGPIPLKKAFRQTLTDASFVAALSDSGLRLDGCAKVKVPFRQVPVTYHMTHTISRGVSSSATPRSTYAWDHKPKQRFLRRHGTVTVLDEDTLEIHQTSGLGRPDRPQIYKRQVQD
jgi:hypothetical protein